MSIVAITDTLGSLGDEVGRELGRVLAYEFADREIIAKAAERFGEDVRELLHVTQEKPTLWERLAATTRHYQASVEAIVFEMAARDNVILLGRGAAFILQKVPHVLRVRITAPEGVRAERVAHQQGIPPDAALNLVRQTDRERIARIRFLYHVDWDDPLLYDLMVNTDRLPVPRAVRLVQEVLAEERFQPSPDARRELTDLSLVAQGRAALLANPSLRHLQLSLTCKNGQIHISGMVEQEGQRQLAQELVGKIPGVAGVLNEIAVVPRLSGHTV